MTILLRAPLLPAALTVIVCAFAADAGPFAMPLGLLLAAACATLAVASVGRRRLVWTAAACAAVGIVTRLGLPGTPWLALTSLDAQRELLARPLALLVPAPDGAILRGIVLGERRDIPADVKLAFAASGTAHLLAISGFHMTVVSGAFALLLRGRVRPLANALLSVGVIALYSALVGFGPSVLRAALMSSVAAVGIASGRRAATANALCAAVTLMLLADPSAVGELGLQLSALATAGLLILQPAVARRIDRVPAPIRGGLATTIAATTPTLPLIAGAFGRLSLISPLANLVCVPLLPVVMLSGAATSVAGILSLDLARPISLLAWAAALTLRVAVETFAALPGASVAVPPGALTGVIVAMFEIGTVVAAPRLATYARGLSWPHPAPPGLSWPQPWLRAPISSRLAGVVLGVALSPIVVAAALPPAGGGDRVIALDIGQGDAYLLEIGGAVVLIDGGPDPYRLMDELGATLPPWQRRIDVVALTHAHTDHGAGLVALFDHYEVGLAIEPEGLNPSILTDLWAAAIAKAGVPRRAVRAGERLSVGAAVIDVLAPDPDLLVDTPDLVLRVEQGAFSALFMGDAMEDAQLRLLERPDQLRARIYVPPHHGAATPYARALRDAAAPDVALISVGAGNRYGHPTLETLTALTGVPTYRTDHDGTVEIALDGTSLVARTHANGLPPPRRGSIPYTPSNG